MAITEHMSKLSKILKKELSDRLKASKMALERAEHLSKIGDYSGAIFSIQQSSELMSKYFIAITYKTGYSEDKNYSHKMKRLFLEYFTKPLKENNIKLPSDFEEKIMKYENLTEEELRNTDYEEIKITIESIEMVYTYYKDFKVILDVINENKTKDIEILEVLRLFPIALFSSAHQFTTRYTDGDIKPWEYDEKIGIVKAIPLLLENLNSIYLNIDKMNEKLK